MKNGSVKFILISSVVITLFSCNSFYVPASTHYPVLHHKKELVTETSLGASGLNLASSYSFADHFYFGGAFHGFADLGGGGENNISVNPHLGFYWEPKYPSTNLNFQLGYGYCHSEFGSLHVSGSSEGEYYYSQASVFFRSGENLNSYIGLGLQYHHTDLRYGHLRLDYNGAPAYMPNSVDFFTTSFMYQRGFNNAPGLGLRFLVGYQWPTSYLDKTYGGFSYYLYLPLLFRLGFSFDLDLRKEVLLEK